MTSTTLFDEDLARRARRLLNGDHRVADLDRLYLGVRARARGFDAVREVGDFVAHRDTRDKGLITQVGRDVFTSVDVWSMAMRGLKASWADLGRAADANLRLASEDQIKAGCGCGRSRARKRIGSALEKIGLGQSITDAEVRALDYLGNRFVWRPAFSDDQLIDELGRLLVRVGLIGMTDLARLAQARAFVALHALAVMHGSSITMPSGHRAKLFAGFSNRDRWLEVKIEIIFAELGKPLMTPVCLFLTDLRPEDHCAASLVTSEPVLIDFWKDPLEVGSDGRLAPIL
jgi:hypothetical protein